MRKIKSMCNKSRMLAESSEYAVKWTEYATERQSTQQGYFAMFQCCVEGQSQDKARGPVACHFADGTIPVSSPGVHAVGQTGWVDLGASGCLGRPAALPLQLLVLHNRSFLLRHLYHWTGRQDCNLS